MPKFVLSFILACAYFFLLIGQAQSKEPASRIGANAKREGDALYSEVKELKFEELKAELAGMPYGSERDFFAGILANRDGRIDDSIRLLDKTIPMIRTSQPEWAALGLEAFADDYLKSYRYADSSKRYDDLLAHFSKQVDRTRLQNIKDDSGTISLLKTIPPQTISWDAPVRLKTERSPIGSIDAELTVNGVKGPWTGLSPLFE